MDGRIDGGMRSDVRAVESGGGRTGEDSTSLSAETSQTMQSPQTADEGEVEDGTPNPTGTVSSGGEGGPPLEVGSTSTLVAASTGLPVLPASIYSWVTALLEVQRMLHYMGEAAADATGR